MKSKGGRKQENYEVILFPLITEKAVNMIESENKLCFIVDKRATKANVKRAVEQAYAVKVDSVRVLNDLKGRKKAIVRVNKAFKADEVATKLGVI
jgi:ribosomal protein uL23